jgi:hypothetical protein
MPAVLEHSGTEENLRTRLRSNSAYHLPRIKVLKITDKLQAEV